MIADLRDDPRQPLRGYPNPNSDEGRPPYHIHLAAWAEDIAAQIYREYEADADIRVGCLHYPERRILWPDGTEPPQRPVIEYKLLPDLTISVSTDEPIVVASGHGIRSRLRLHNRQERVEVVRTNGGVTARVLDHRTGAVVGTDDRAQILPEVTFQIPAGGSSTIPLIVGTASLVGDIGYAIPPGPWAFDVVLDLQSGRYRTPPMPMTVGD